MTQVTEATWSELIARCRGRWVSQARRLVGDPHEAEDVVQSVLSDVWRRVRSGGDVRQLERYVTRAVRVGSLKHRNRRRRQQTLELGAELPTVDTAEADISPAELERAIASLPLTQQTVVRMKYYLDMTFSQIGLTLSISSNTAASRCRYALLRLREHLKEKP